MDNKPRLNKGFLMEEQLRLYFLNAGYYVVRGVPFIVDKLDITDIDLWLYGRFSSVSRETTIVDIKNKKTPQAIERIFWIKGLKEATNSNSAIVATTDKRKEVKDFGKQLDVVVLDGNFITKVKNMHDLGFDRISDEALIVEIEKYPLNKIDGNWKERIRQCKSKLAQELSFSSCNEWLSHAGYFAEQALVKPQHSDVAIRCMYLICSFFAIGIDYQIRELFFINLEERKKIIKNGFDYGSNSSFNNKKLIELSTKLISDNVANSETVVLELRRKVDQKISSLNNDILSEFFCQHEISINLFNIAKDLEAIAMSSKVEKTLPKSLLAKSFIFCLLDYWQIERSKFAEILQP